MAVSIVNQWTGSATALSSSITASVANTPGNWLIVLAGWNPNAVASPVVQVCDDARNYWIPVTVSSSAGKTRCMAWAAPNTRAAALVSVSPAAWVDGLTVTVLEVTGLPQYCSIDVVASTQVTAATSVSVSASPTGADAVFAVACFSNVALTYTVTGSGFTALTQVSASNATDGTGVDDTVIAPCWRTTSGAGAVTASWTMSGSVNASAVIIAVAQLASPPVQPNPSWPLTADQLAFGYQPGDPSALPTWTDITANVSALSCKRGRQYELDKLQAGTANVDFRNNSGNFDPTNASSAYAPNVVPYVPYHRLATWNNTTYPVFSGYIERWPQSWDGSRYGWSKAAAVDTLAPLAAVTLPSAIGSEILADQPYGYWPFNDSQNATAAGNASGRTQYALTQMTGQAGAAGTAAFGAQLGMPGDTGTGWQQQGLTNATPYSAGWMLTAIDRAVPAPPAGVGIEVWAQCPSTDATTSNPPYLWSLAAPTNATASNANGVLGQLDTTGKPWCQAGTTTASDTTAVGTGNYLDGKWHHHFVWVTSTNVKWWVDGVLNINHNWTVTLSGGQSIVTFGGINFVGLVVPTANAILAHGAVYDALPTLSRIQAHYQAGATGFAGEGSGTRSQRILSYGAWTQARLVDAGDTTMQAAADLLGKSVPDALGDAFDTEIGLPSVDGAGTIRIRARHYTYNRPTQWFLDELAGISLGTSDGTFESGVSGWTPVSATFVQSSAQAHTGTHSGLLTVTGSPTQAYVRPAQAAVTGGVSYTLSLWVYVASGAPQVTPAIDWFDGTGTYITTSLSGSVALTATWSQQTVTAVAPSNAAHAAWGPTITGSPATGTAIYVDDVAFSQAGAPFLGDVSFDTDPTFVDNKITVDRNGGGQGIAQDTASQKAYFTRTLPRTSYANADQDAVDQANWLLGNYRAPHLRVSEVTLDPASNPGAWPTALGVDVGDVVTVTRRPTYAPAISGTFVVQQVSHDIGPGKWQTKLTLAPVPIPVLTCDDSTYGVLGSNALGW